jgi:hypothetical protein
VNATTPDSLPGSGQPRADRRISWVWFAIGLALVIGFLLGSRGRDSSMQRYSYSGTVDSVCRGASNGSGVSGCFSITLDPGIAHADGYYSGQGSVSFGPPPSDGPPIEIGEHVTVTVVTVRDAGSAVVQVAPA